VRKSLKRKSDLNNINEIPLMKQTMNTIKDSVLRIEKKIEDYNGLKTDVNWLKGWHKVMVLGVLSSLVICMVILIFRR
jgi:hypothetical protein